MPHIASSESVKHKADISLAALKPLHDRLIALGALFTSTDADILKKIGRIKSAHSYQTTWADADELEDLREDRAELEGSSCLGRAIDEYEFIIGNMAEIVRELRRLRGETA